MRTFPKRGNAQMTSSDTSCLTWMVKAVSFFLLMVRSSMVSATDRLIILLTGQSVSLLA